MRFSRCGVVGRIGKRGPGAGVSRSRGGGKAARFGYGVRLAVICPAGHPAGTCLRRSPVFAAQAGFKRAKDEKVLSPIGENGAVCCRKMQQFGREWKGFGKVLCFAQVRAKMKERIRQFDRGFRAKKDRLGGVLRRFCFRIKAGQRVGSLVGETPHSPPNRAQALAPVRPGIGVVSL